MLGFQNGRGPILSSGLVTGLAARGGDLPGGVLPGSPQARRPELLLGGGPRAAASHQPGDTEQRAQAPASAAGTAAKAPSLAPSPEPLLTQVIKQEPDQG